MHNFAQKSRTFIDRIQVARNLLKSTNADDNGSPVEYSINPPTAPLVSIEVLVYNQATTLEQCVRSIATQQVDFSFEIIIGNDCSTDDSLSVARNLLNLWPNKIRIVSTTKNVGLNRNARNVRRVMRGQYAAFCEGDDWWSDPLHLAKQVTVLKKYPDVTLVHGLPAYWNESTQTYSEDRQRFSPPENHFPYILDESYRIETASVACRVRDLKRIYKEAPHLIDSHFLMLDTQLFCLLASWGKVYTIPEAISIRRLSGKSLSINKDPFASFRYNDNAFTMMLKLCDYFHTDNAVRRRIYNRYLSSAIIILHRAFNRQDIFRILRILYPNHLLRTFLLCWIPPPRHRFLHKLYFHFIFSTHRWRRAFG